MASKTELERIAQMAGALRPDWNPRSVLTLLVNEHAHRAYRDLAVAMAYIATDPATHTPKRLSEAGPWWATSKDAPEPIHYTRCPQPGHTSYPAHNCGACRSEALERTTQEAALIRQHVPPERIREIRAGVQPTHRGDDQA
jgi:hypothetical protein